MAQVMFENHSSVIVPRKERGDIRRFYCDVLGGRLTKEEHERDFVRLNDDYYIVFLYDEVADVSEFLQLAAEIPLRPEVEEFALADANRALVELKTRRVRGAKVLRVV